MFDRNEIVMSAHDAAMLSAVLATLSPREALLPGAAGELAEMLAHATLVPRNALSRDAIGLDAEVTYVELPRGTTRTVRLVHPAASDPAAARISVFAPVARALLGRRVGARVPVALPDAEIDELHVVSVRHARRPS
ncbi:MAG TPA: GreA/GreB family elongation factor [Casimicrobiaceae bacterium]|nr:GreA/GreB family elongation factor [Casimicrobiaceae bacterium]